VDQETLGHYGEFEAAYGESAVTSVSFTKKVNGGVAGGIDNTVQSIVFHAEGSLCLCWYRAEEDK